MDHPVEQIVVDNTAVKVEQVQSKLKKEHQGKIKQIESLLVFIYAVLVNKHNGASNT
jgi:hypothetical protein